MLYLLRESSFLKLGLPLLRKSRKIRNFNQVSIRFRIFISNVMIITYEMRLANNNEEMIFN